MNSPNSLIQGSRRGYIEPDPEEARTWIAEAHGLDPTEIPLDLLLTNTETEEAWLKAREARLQDEDEYIEDMIERELRL